MEQGHDKQSSLQGSLDSGNDKFLNCNALRFGCFVDLAELINREFRFDWIRSKNDNLKRSKCWFGNIPATKPTINGRFRYAALLSKPFSAARVLFEPIFDYFGFHNPETSHQFAQVANNFTQTAKYYLRKLRTSVKPFTQTANNAMEITLTISPTDKLTAEDIAAVKAAADTLNITSEEFVAAAVADALKKQAA